MRGETTPDSNRAWQLLVDRLDRFDRQAEAADEADKQAWAAYREDCRTLDKVLAGLAADTAALQIWRAKMEQRFDDLGGNLARVDWTRTWVPLIGAIAAAVALLLSAFNLTQSARL